MRIYQSSICILHFAFCTLHFFLPFCAKGPVAVPVEGERFAAKLVAADARWQLTFAVGKQQRTLLAADLVRWGRCVEQGRAGGLVLADGSLLTAEVVAADKDRLTVDSDLFGTLKLPLDLLAGIVLRAPSDRQQHDLLIDRLGDCPNFRLSENGTVPLRAILHARPANDSDRLLLDNGDELAGFFEGMADDAVTFKTDVGPVPVKIDRITAILFNPALQRKPSVKAHSHLAWAGFTDGSRLLATELVIEGDSLKITVAGQTLAAKRSTLVFLQPLAGRAAVSLRPQAGRISPNAVLLPSPSGRGAGGEGSRQSRDLSWPYRPDRNVTGGMLRCGGRLWLKGIGVHSAARLVYTISPPPVRERGRGRGQQLPSPFGRGAGGEGREGARGQGPGARISKSIPFRGPRRHRRLHRRPWQRDFPRPGRRPRAFRKSDPPRRRCPRAGFGRCPRREEVGIVVDYADRGDVLDHADWLDARLIP